MPEEQLVFAYFDGSMFSFERAYEHSDSVFGGWMEPTISGIEHGPKPLHMIARLAASDFFAQSESKLFDVPLIYGLCYDGCSIEYRVDAVGNIMLTELSRTDSSDDWPYRNFPALLPYVPLRVGGRRRASYTDFAERFPNMPERQSAELMVAVPPPATLGVSLWGIGDLDNVTILFECHLEDRAVVASNRVG
jgi:hypothetical protein